MADTVASTAQEENDGHKALLELEAQFHAKSRNTFFNVQGSQIYALTSFTRIFEQYPYPVVINAAILKLADWFRTNNNIVKYYVFKVFKDASDQHLAKVFNIEETVRRIMTVLGSNDPIARSITLRILGCMAKIVSEKLEVHHAILQRLEAATGRIEIEAAIWASDNFCASSLRFPSVIFPKLSAKVQDPTISLDVKLRYIKIFRHMHRDIAMARQAKTICLGLLDNPNTEEKLVIVTLRTLTLLLSKALMDRKEQVKIEEGRVALQSTSTELSRLIRSIDYYITPFMTIGLAFNTARCTMWYCSVKTTSCLMKPTFW
ncbi:uncharacterized protein BYT42DRAFT_492775 [Radiomyces spectabilis]|uniref:uncharacterized protein n=1 Tax=Radiomyces spectabilis TaxID=64574 RepID=UPI002220BF3D|nr:uncharacterized protein BYT42DRAFT_492775 [Radiomyces spectabilis]KAI8384306.1 hypothetical protein BYT42DRAFT_492775 [Radiomyces spectabilis]